MKDERLVFTKKTVAVFWGCFSSLQGSNIEGKMKYYYLVTDYEEFFTIHPVNLEKMKG